MKNSCKQCGYEEMGRRCPDEALADNIFCETHKLTPRYLVLVCGDNAETFARGLRRNGFNANVYQRVNVIIGPTNSFVQALVPHGIPYYEALMYEDALLALIAGQGLDLSHIVGAEGSIDG